MKEEVERLKKSKSENEMGKRSSLLETALLDALQTKELAIAPGELKGSTLVKVLREKLRSR